MSEEGREGGYATNHVRSRGNLLIIGWLHLHEMHKHVYVYIQCHTNNSAMYNVIQTHTYIHVHVACLVTMYTLIFEKHCIRLTWLMAAGGVVHQ